MDAPAFLEAHNMVTALQQRVLSVLTTEHGLLPEDVAQAAGLWHYEVTRSRKRPDVVTARNVLGWLGNKGFAQCVYGRWYRTFSVREPTHTSA